MSSLELRVAERVFIVRMPELPEDADDATLYAAVSRYDEENLTCVGRLLDLANRVRLLGDHWTPRRGRATILDRTPSPASAGEAWMMLSPREREAQAKLVADDLIARDEPRARAMTAGVMSLHVPREEAVRLLAAIADRDEAYAKERLKGRGFESAQALVRREAAIAAGSPVWLVPLPDIGADDQNRQTN